MSDPVVFAGEMRSAERVLRALPGVKITDAMKALRGALDEDVRAGRLEMAGPSTPAVREGNLAVVVADTAPPGRAAQVMLTDAGIVHTVALYEAGRLPMRQRESVDMETVRNGPLGPLLALAPQTRRFGIDPAAPPEGWAQAKSQALLLDARAVRAEPAAALGPWRADMEWQRRSAEAATLLRAVGTRWPETRASVKVATDSLSESCKDTDQAGLAALRAVKVMKDLGGTDVRVKTMGEVMQRYLVRTQAPAAKAPVAAVRD